MRENKRTGIICSNIISRLEELAPCKYAYSWDNVGLLVGRREKCIQRVMITLDATEEMIEQAVAEEIDMIITHHPLIFSGLKQVTTSDFTQRRVYTLIQHDICCYAMHTNFDVMRMADVVADELQLQDTKILDVTYKDSETIEGCGRYGTLLESCTLEQYADEIKKRLKLEQVFVYGALDSTIKSAAIMPGSGADMIPNALEASVDVLITGDIKYHQGIDGVAQGLALIDAGHYGTEKMFIPYVKEYLSQNTDELVIKMYNQEEPFQVV